ncbi:molybdenum cofactor guanylyltransferase [Flexivirga alba]|uniref:Molybdenum cofactor guanylyltransferase n=1 Tax=Flexivirga alba TaxID=702742 RepID=A0ABW2AAL2_9MICO
MSAPVEFDAIVLVGGAGARLGGIDKAAVQLAGRSLVSRPLEAVRDAQTLVVVGHTSAEVPERAVRVVEEPAGSGPAAASVAGLRAIQRPAEWTYLIACDLPGAVSAIQLLGAADAGDADGVVLAEPDGRLQWLLGRYRSSALRAAADALGDPANRSMRALLGDLRLAELPADDVWRDVDTWADHEQWARALDDSRATPPPKGQ